jgi:hypothetical protein
MSGNRNELSPAVVGIRELSVAVHETLRKFYVSL